MYLTNDFLNSDINKRILLIKQNSIQKYFSYIFLI